MPKVLVVYYSRSGATARFARDIARTMGADCEGIEESSHRQGRLGYLRSLIEAIAKGLPTMRTYRDPHAYDLVVIGTPVWAHTISAPVRSYLHQHRARLPRVAFFATMGGSGATAVLEEMKLFCGANDAPTCFVTEHAVRSGSTHKEVGAFVAALMDATRATTASSAA